MRTCYSKLSLDALAQKGHKERKKVPGTASFEAIPGTFIRSSAAYFSLTVTVFISV